MFKQDKGRSSEPHGFLWEEHSGYGEEDRLTISWSYLRTEGRRCGGADKSAGGGEHLSEGTED